MQDTQAVDSNPIVAKIISTMGELPASPAIVSTVMGLTSNLDTDVAQLGKVLSADQALSAKVLKLSNSSFYGRPKGVGTLKEAILILGFYTLRSLVVASSTHSLFKKKNESYVEQRLWEHSLATAMASRIISRKIRHPQIEEAFIVGLMHDLGKLILSQKLSEQYELVCRQVESESLTFMEVETEQLGFGHVEVGRLLFERWNFPSMLTSAISNHHDPRHDDDADTERLVASNVPIAFITQFCNELAKQIDCGFNDRRLDDLTSLPLAQIAGFGQIDIDNLVEELDEAYQSEKYLFEE